MSGVLLNVGSCRADRCRWARAIGAARSARPQHRRTGRAAARAAGPDPTGRPAPPSIASAPLVASAALRLSLTCGTLPVMGGPTSIVTALDLAGYRLTEPRRSVAALIAEQDGHFTAAELVRAGRVVETVGTHLESVGRPAAAQ